MRSQEAQRRTQKAQIKNETKDDEQANEIEQSGIHL